MGPAGLSSRSRWSVAGGNQKEKEKRYQGIGGKFHRLYNRMTGVLLSVG